MNTAKTATKQTAANNTFLAGIKKHWNYKIFKKASQILNQDGKAAAIAYLQQFTTATLKYND